MGGDRRLKAQEARRALRGVKWRGSGVLDVSTGEIVLGLEDEERPRNAVAFMARGFVLEHKRQLSCSRLCATCLRRLVYGLLWVSLAVYPTPMTKPYTHGTVAPGLNSGPELPYCVTLRKPLQPP